MSGAAADRFASYRRSPVSVAVVFHERTTWADIRSNMWSEDQYAGWQGRLSISVPLLPSAEASSLSDVASGLHDADLASLARELAARGRGSSIIRLGWEFNGNMWPWSAYDPETYIAAFRRVVLVMRAIAPNLEFEWCGNAMDNQAGHDPFTELYPGNDVVDIIGLDAYDNQWANAKTTSGFQAWVDRPYGLAAWSNFATAHDKPFAVSEWGLSVTGEGDNTVYIQGMYDWFSAHASELSYESYFDEPAYDVQNALDSGQMPHSSALYARLWHANS